MTRCAVALVLAGCGALARSEGEQTGTSSSFPDAAWHYDVSVSQDLSHADVRLDLRGPAPSSLILGMAEGMPALGDVVVRWGTNEMLLAAEDDGFGLDDVGADAVVRYRVDLARLVDDRHASRVGKDVAVTPGMFLLRPRPLPEHPRASLTLHLPAGSSASLPWARDAGGTYVLDASTFRWRGAAFFGPMEQHEVRAGGSTLEVAVLDHPRCMTWPATEHWIVESAGAVADLYAGFPAARCQVVVKPVPSDEAVPFGETLRGGGRATILYIGDEAKDDAFADDWVAVHELTHLGMPAIPEEDAWLSEGFVQYYTETLRGRAGILTERAAWQSLVDGFERGRRSGTGAALAEESASMHRTHAWYRVYWGGAAIAFLLDVDLRRASAGRISLDDAMREVQRALSPRPVEASAQEILAHLDAWLGRPVFSETAARHLAEKRFPAVEETLTRLGVLVEEGRVVLDDRAPEAALRRSLMTRTRR